MNSIEPGFFNDIKAFLESYSFGLPTGVAALILVLVGLKIKNAILKLIGLALVVAAIVLFVIKK